MANEKPPEHRILKLVDPRGRRAIDPTSLDFKEKEALRMKREERVRAHLVASHTTGSIRRTEQAFKTMTAAVTNLIAKPPAAIVERVLTEYRPDAVVHAKRMADWWNEVTHLLQESREQDSEERKEEESEEGRDELPRQERGDPPGAE